MDFNQLMTELGIDIPVLMNRFSGSEALVKRFLLKFPDDKTYGRLCDAVAAKDVEVIKNEAHAMKGIALNLGLNVIGNLSSELCEQLRAEDSSHVDELFAGITADYNRAVRLIKDFIS